jgi:hypothetical protein
VKSALEFAVAAQFYNDNLVNAEAHKVEGLVGLFFFVHGWQDGRLAACGVWSSANGVAVNFGKSDHLGGAAAGLACVRASSGLCVGWHCVRARPSKHKRQEHLSPGSPPAFPLHRFQASNHLPLGDTA